MVLVPVIAFTGFHPNFILLEQMDGPMGPFHSAIVLFAFRAGLSLDEAEACFTHEAFGALQYFTMWELSKVEQVAAGHRVGVDLSRDVLRWMRRGCFMHNAIHPKAFVLFDLAKCALSKVGLPTCNVDFDDFAFDALASNYICPVYPPVAAMLGVSGSYLFKRPDSQLKRQRGFIELRRFIEASYAAYRRVPPMKLHHARVDAWLDNSEIRRLFCRTGLSKGY